MMDTPLIILAGATGNLGGRIAGSQYAHNMFSGTAKLEPLDNDRYPGIRWTAVRDVLAAGESL